MTTTPILNLPQVASNQNQKETTINTAMAILEAAMNDAVGISLASGNHTLTTDEFTKFFHQKYSGQTAARQVTIPTTKRWFAASNTGAFDITIKCNGSVGATLTLAAGKRVLALSDGVDVVAISQGVSSLQDLSDVVGAADASAGQLLGFDATTGTWTPVDNPADLLAFVAGAPSASQKLTGRIFARAARYSSDFNQSQVKAGVAATAAATFNVKKNGTLVGTIHFAIGATVATFSTDVGAGSVSVSVAIGDVLTIEAPATPDATLADISFCLKGVYQ
jgi:hypothetical protein